MTASTVLWDAVKTDYDAAGLISLSNIRNRNATTINDAAGVLAATSVITLWPIYAQEIYDENNPIHVEIAEVGVIAMLWRRGGSSSSIEQVKWDEVFGDSGMIKKLVHVSARGRLAPSSNSGVSQTSELTSDGKKVRGWSDRDSLPTNFLSTRFSADY